MLTYRNFCVPICEYIAKLKEIYNRALPSIEHQIAWKHYEIILHYRANVCFISKLLFTGIFIVLGQANWQQSQKFMAKSDEYNESFVQQVFPIVKWALITMTIGRLLLLLISLKNIQVCRTYLYYQVVFMVVEMLLPVDNGDFQLNRLMMNNAFNFLLLFHNFWPGCLSMLLCQIILLPANYLVYDKEIDSKAVVACLFGLFYQFFNLFMINLGANMLGLLFVNKEILQKGNENLLNESSEGIIIIDQENEMLLFVNTVARALNLRAK